MIEKLRSSVLVMISALTLAGCMAGAVDSDAVETEQYAVRTEVMATFASPADAEAAAASLESLDDGTMVLAIGGDGATFEAVVTRSAMASMLANPTLASLEDLTAEKPAVDEKTWGSCVGYCGGREPETGCFCDSWCWVFGDCCLDYYDGVCD